MASPLGLLYLRYDRKPGRSWQAEVAAPAAVAAASASEAAASGWELAPALALWFLAAARSLPAVLYVRERLHLERSGRARQGLPWVAHLLAVLGVAGLVASGLAPWLAILPFVLLLGRAVAGLGPMRRPASAKVVGISEIVWGVVTVTGLVAAWALGGSP